MSDPTDVVSKMRALEADHKPDGWPAVQMRDISTLCYMIEDYRRDSAIYETAFDEAEADVKQSVQKQMAELRAENARLKRELSTLIGEFTPQTPAPHASNRPSVPGSIAEPT